MAKSQWLKGVRQKEEEENGGGANREIKTQKQNPRNAGGLNDIVSR